MAINTINATIQMRKGLEQDFDADQMTAGEWSVSTDSKKVWMCFRPGLVLRMSTYEAFEKDMEIIKQILKECQEIQVAVELFVNLAEQHKNEAELYSKESQSWAVGGTGTRVGEDSDNSKYYSEQSKKWSDAAKNAIDLSKPTFTVDLGTGHLLYSGGKFDFEVGDNGHLFWGLTL